MTHLIRQQYLHVEVHGSESDGLAVQRRLPGLCQNWLFPALERVLERCAPTTGHLYIERLEIDAGSLGLERLEPDLAELAAQALEKSLREHLPQPELVPEVISSTIRYKTDQYVVEEAFVYFLQNGSLPWSFRLPAGRTLEQAVLASWQDLENSGLEPLINREAMLRVLAEATVRQRLTRQFSPAFLATLLSLLSPGSKDVITGVLQTLRTAAQSPGPRKLFTRLLWETAFGHIAQGRDLTDVALVGDAWRTLPKETADHPALAKSVEQHRPDITHTSQAHPRKPTLLDRVETEKSVPLEPLLPGLTYSGETLPGRGEHPDAREGIYIDNAGLVLVHPFLPQFFAALGLAAADKLLEPERALCLLYFLATGQTRPPEYELVLPKLLCNIPLSTPVNIDLELTDLEISEATVLLEAVIRHWEALRQTSPDGLRGTFLLRPGKVSSLADGDWLLQVETNAFDILLDQLPWGISPVKLPWLTYLFWVEWI